MSRLSVPRWVFHALLGAGLLVQLIATHPAVQTHSPRLVTWLAGILTFYVAPYMTLFFWAFTARDWRAGYVGVFAMALVMALVFQRLAPPRLTLRQAGLTAAAWLGLGALLLALLLIVGR